MGVVWTISPSARVVFHIDRDLLRHLLGNSLGLLLCRQFHAARILYWYSRQQFRSETSAFGPPYNVGKR